MVPRQSRETLRPVVPRFTYSIVPSFIGEFLYFNFFKSQSQKQAGDRSAGVDPGGIDNAALQRLVRELAFGLLAPLRFQIHIDGHQEPGAAGIDARPAVI